MQNVKVLEIVTNWIGLERENKRAIASVHGKKKKWISWTHDMIKLDIF